MPTSPPIAAETPEEAELRAKKQELLALETSLTEFELSLASERAELRAFEARYTEAVGPLFARLDEINAQIAERIARRDAANTEAQHRALNARARAARSAAAVAAPILTVADTPTPRMRDLFRLLAKKVHPDLASNDQDRSYRQEMMAKVNDAYERGDERALEELFQEIHHSPEAIAGDDTGSDLVRTIRKIARAKRRIEAIIKETETLRELELHRLMRFVQASSSRGRDQIADIQHNLRDSIKDAELRLKAL